MPFPFEDSIEQQSERPSRPPHFFPGFCTQRPTWRRHRLNPVSGERILPNDAPLPTVPSAESGTDPVDSGQEHRQDSASAPIQTPSVPQAHLPVSARSFQDRNEHPTLGNRVPELDG